MFGLKLLDDQPRSGPQFTPIGRRKQPGSLRPVDIPSPVIRDENAFDTTFDDTMQPAREKILYDSVHIPADRRPLKSRSNNGTNTNILSSNAGSVQELRADNEKLNSENFDLKLELDMFKRMLKRAPEEYQQLASENIKFQQQLAQLQTKESSENEDGAFELLRALYNEAVAEKDAEIEHLAQQISQLQRREPEIRTLPEVLEELRDLKNDNQQLRRQLQESHTRDTSNLSETQRENNELKLLLSRLQTKYAQIPTDAGSRLEAATAEVDMLQRKVASLEKALEQAEAQDVNYARANVSYKAEIDHLSAEVRNLRSENDAMRYQQNDNDQLDALISKIREENIALKSDTRRLESELSNLKADSDAESKRLHKRIEVLTQEMKDHDKEEFALRAQVLELMRERASQFQDQSTIRHYEDQIEKLRSRDRELSKSNDELKAEIAKLQDELYTHNVDTSRITKLRTQNDELQDKLDFYEKEYGDLQEGMESAETQIDELKTKIKLTEARLLDAEHESNELLIKLRRTEAEMALKFNASAFVDFESQQRRQAGASKTILERERQVYEQQIDDLQLRIDNLERQLRREPLPGTWAESGDYKRLLNERSRLEREVAEYLLRLQDQESKLLRFEKALKEKDDLVSALESRSRELENLLRKENRFELNRVQDEYEWKLRNAQKEADWLRDELKTCEAKLSILSERNEDSGQKASASIIGLLESQVDDLQSRNKGLTEQLASLERSVKREKTVALERVELTEKNYEIQAKLKDAIEEGNQFQSKLNQALQEKTKLQRLVDTLEDEKKHLRQEKTALENKADELSSDLSRTTRHCSRLASKVNEITLHESNKKLQNVDDQLRASKTNSKLQKRIDELSSQLASSRISPNLETRQRLLQNEQKYNRVRITELHSKLEDVSFLNSVLSASAKKAADLLKEDVAKMMASGIQPIFLKERSGPKITFKLLATFVLAAVRIKRRQERAADRRVRLDHLKYEIDKDRLELL